MTHSSNSKARIQKYNFESVHPIAKRELLRFLKETKQVCIFYVKESYQDEINKRLQEKFVIEKYKNGLIVQVDEVLSAGEFINVTLLHKENSQSGALDNYVPLDLPIGPKNPILIQTLSIEALRPLVISLQ